MKKRKLWIAIGSAILLIILLIIAILVRNGKGESEIVIAQKKDLVETVQISGRVESDIVANIGFESAGTVRNVFVKVNDKVNVGQSLATLNLGTLLADLKSALAEVAIKKAELGNISLNLETVRKQQDTLVANAYQELLSDSLIAEPGKSSFDQTPPVVTGRYSGEKGTYKIEISSGSSFADYKIQTFSLERTDKVDISQTGPTPLGTRGLFISFPDDLSSYTETTWHVDIPNTSSDEYASKLSAYEEALKERSRAIESAEAELRKEKNETSVAEAELMKAEAAADRIRAQILDRTLIAPFNGTITRVDLNPGETVTANQDVISIISEGKLGVEIDLPEIDSVKVSVGDQASVILDVFGDKKFEAVVTSVNRSETFIDGVPVYEARVVFTGQSGEIISGMTADVTIVTNEKASVIAVPVRAIETGKDSRKFVRAIDSNSDKMVEKDVTVGLESTDGYVEILSGIDEGTQVLVSK